MKQGQPYDIAVIHLVWLPFGIDLFKEFIDSYLIYPAGYPHKLIIAFNGLKAQHPNNPGEYIDYIKEKGILNFECLYFESGQDISIYKQAAATISNEYILFLNSYSKIRAGNWLYFYVQNYTNNVGLIGATGSFSSYLAAINRKTARDVSSRMSVIKKIQSIKYAIKLNTVYRKWFSKFPNPHVRTTAFFIKRTIFNDIEMVDPKNKLQAYFFENGVNSITRQVLNKKLECVLIDKYGNCYKISEWPESKTFWQAGQENLLIADNQTEKYDLADIKIRRLLSCEAWGK
ncbi:MAG TPA: hypothetical protein VG738_07720 [Chitinophagaceae bacterium]|nr:hypothetical protein [Chitinophagaceae bacterium]